MGTLESPLGDMPFTVATKTLLLADKIVEAARGSSVFAQAEPQRGTRRACPQK